jgi:ABC-type branched-subunit amino acid transport system substrate-binding protein
MVHDPRAARRTSLALALLASAGLTSACTAPADDSEVRGVTDDTILIGTWAPLTGPAALWGDVGRGTQIYFDMINEEGGIHGRRLQLILRDDGYQPARTVAAVREMVERDGVFAFVGGVGTATGRAVLDYIVENEIVWVSPSTGATHWAYPPKRHVFSMYTPYFDEAAVLVDHAVEQLGVSRIAVIYQNDDFGASGLVGAQMAMERHGLELVEAAPVEVADTDLSSHAVLLRESGAEAVLMWLTPRHATIIMGAAGRMDHQPQWLASSVLGDVTQMYELTDGAWAGVIYTGIAELATSDHPGVQKYKEAITRLAPGERPNEFLLSGFRYAEPLVEGLRRAGPDLTTERLIAALESFEDFKGVGPPLTFRPDKRQGTRAMFLARCIDGDNVERLTDWVESGIDIETAIARLEGGSGE